MISLVKSVRCTAEVDVNHCLESTLALLAHDLHPRITVIKDYGSIPTVQGDAGAVDAPSAAGTPTP